jgi:hypothetical protein
MKQMIKGFGTVLFAVAVSVVMATFGYGLIWGAARISEKLIGPAILVSDWTLTICVIVLLPLSFFRLTRVASIFGFYASSCIFGVTALMGAFVAVLYYWGVGWTVCFVLFLTPAVILPMGILAAIINADWSAVGMLVAGGTLTIGSYLISCWLASVQDRANERRAAKRFTRQTRMVGGIAPVFD